MQVRGLEIAAKEPPLDLKSSNFKNAYKFLSARYPKDVVDAEATFSVSDFQRFEGYGPPGP